MEKSTQRDNKIDIVKAIGIILMVFYHARTPGKDFVYLFHMALFFICSGYCYSHNSENVPKKYLKKKIKTLYFPCLISGLIIACLQNFLLDMHIYSYAVYNKLDFMGWLKQVLKCFAFGGGHQMIGANWFFRTLFLSSVLFFFLNRFLKKFFYKDNHIVLFRGLICFFLTGLGGFLGTHLSFGKYFNFLTVMVLLDLGLLLKEKKLLQCLNTINKKIIAGLIGLLNLIVMSFFGEISINSNIIINPLYFVLCSVSGFIMIYVISDFLASTRMEDKLVYLGQETIWIMFFHYIGFKFITFCEIIVLAEPIINLSAYPTHHTTHGMWFVYGLAGILVPLLMIRFGKILKRAFKKYQSN